MFRGASLGVKLMFSNISRLQSVWIYAAVFGALATAVKFIIDPNKWPSPIVAGVAAFLISAVAYRAQIAAGKSMTVIWAAMIGAATGLFTPLLMYLLHGLALGVAIGQAVDMVVWSVANAWEMLMQVGVYLIAGGAIVGDLLLYTQSTFIQPTTT
jgi:uncharacterized membrane protein